MDRLRSLPRLIILDTSGNPVCSSPHFRLQVLFKIPTLKVRPCLPRSVSLGFRAKDKRTNIICHLCFSSGAITRLILLLPYECSDFEDCLSFNFGAPGLLETTGKNIVMKVPCILVHSDTIVVNNDLLHAAMCKDVRIYYRKTNNMLNVVRNIAHFVWGGRY